MATPKQIQAAKAQVNADAGRVIELRARIEMMQDELAEAEQRADASRRAANSLMHYHEAAKRLMAGVAYAKACT